MREDLGLMGEAFTRVDQRSLKHLIKGKGPCPFRRESGRRVRAICCSWSGVIFFCARALPHLLSDPTRCPPATRF